MYEKLLKLLDTYYQRTGVRYEKNMSEVLFKLWQATPPFDTICLFDVSEYFEKGGDLPYALRVEEQTVVDWISAWFNRRNSMISDGSGSGYRKTFVECLGILSCAAESANIFLIDSYALFMLYSRLCERY